MVDQAQLRMSVAALDRRVSLPIRYGDAGGAYAAPVEAEIATS